MTKKAFFNPLDCKIKREMEVWYFAPLQQYYNSSSPLASIVMTFMELGKSNRSLICHSIVRKESSSTMTVLEFCS